MRSIQTGKCFAAVLLLIVCAAPSAAQATWKVQQDLSIGGDDDRTIFVDIRGVIAGPTGNIFVLDFRTQDIRMFDASGRFVKVVARRGQGPGELANANGMLLAPDGTIWVNDPSNSRWSAFSSTDGAFIRQVRLPIRGWGYIWVTGLDTRGRIVDQISVQSATLRAPDGSPAHEGRLRVVDVRSNSSPPAADSVPIGPPADTLARPGCAPRVIPTAASFVGYNEAGRAVAYYGIPFQPRSLSEYGLDGTLWCTGSDEFTIVHRSVGTGDTLHVIRRSYPAVPVTADERRDAIARGNEFLARYPRKDMDASLIPARKPVVAALHLDRSGNVWVLRTPARTDAPGMWEVFDRTGRPVANATADFAIRAPIPPFITDDAMYAVVADEDGVLSVVRAKIVRQ